MKSVASIPSNYVSILQLQERWMKEKERRKHKETDLGAKQQQQQVNGQRRIQEEEEPRVNLEGHFRINRLEKEPNCVEKEEAEVSAVVSKEEEEEEDGEYWTERKKKWSKKKKKKKNQGGSVKEILVKCVSNQVKVEIPGEETVQNRENTTATASNLIAVDTQFQHLQIKKTVEENVRHRQVKGPARLNSGYRNQKHESRTMVWVKKGD
ncbi:hypothetical protein N665_0790s0028 [Sinapis alba]|nr:hypothetical protein N665_0790s0028 [Sinapis alba]